MTSNQRTKIAYAIKHNIKPKSVYFGLDPEFTYLSVRTIQRWMKDVRAKEEAIEKGLKVQQVTEDYINGRLPSQQQEQAFFKKPSHYYTVVMGCRHMPFHDKEQYKADVQLIKYLAKNNITDLILNGDILDMHSISRHMQKRKLKIEGLNLEKEYAMSLEAISELEGIPLRKKTYMWGNHETWYWTYLSELEKTKLGNLLPKPSNLFGDDWVKMEDYVNDYVMVGDLRVIHGVFVSTHAAKAHLDKFKGNIMFAHTHRMQQFTDSHGDETITAYNIGWGGDKNSPVFSYMSALERSSWQQGIAVAYTDVGGRTSVQVLQWQDGKYIFGDKVVTKDGVFPATKSVFECY